MNIKSVYLLLIINSFLNSQNILIKGQFWSNFLINEKKSSYVTNFGYIPAFSLSKESYNKQLIDIELSNRFEYDYLNNSFKLQSNDFHRAWIRYSSEKFEARLGLQKIIFGPSQLLRSLSWFDTIDLKDPTGQTNGVEGFRLRWFASTTISNWAWIIKNDIGFLTYGLRTEFTSVIGDWGITYHKDPSENLDTLDQNNSLIIGPNYDRLGLDFRYDGNIGFWNENSLIISETNNLGMVTVGADYTVPVLNGIMLMSETLYTFSKLDLSLSPNVITAIMTSMPIGIFYNIMLISSWDWNNNNNNYFRFSSAYDSFSFNLMLSFDSNNINNNLQFMIIYDH